MTSKLILGLDSYTFTLSPPPTRPCAHIHACTCARMTPCWFCPCTSHFGPLVGRLPYSCLVVKREMVLLHLAMIQLSTGSGAGNCQDRLTEGLWPITYMVTFKKSGPPANAFSENRVLEAPLQHTLLVVMAIADLVPFQRAS